MNALNLFESHFFPGVHAIHSFAEQILMSRIIFLRAVLQIRRREKPLFISQLVDAGFDLRRRHE